MLARKASFLASISFFLAGLACCGESIPNWSAPTTWSPTKTRGGLSAMDVTNPLPFIGLAPCRIVDTRGNGAPITGGMFTGGSDVRNYAVSGICGIPTTARALSLNFTVTGPGQTTAGFLLAWPTGGAVPPVSILNWDHVPAQIANAAVVPTNASVSFTVNVSSPTHVIIDVNGYYPQLSPVGTLAPNEQFVIEGSVAGDGVILGTNNSSGSSYGVLGAARGTPNAAGVFGMATSSTGVVWGVLGLSDSNSNGAAGVYGKVNLISGANQYGVYGSSLNTSGIPAGVAGVDFSGPPPFNPAVGTNLPSGVLGLSATKVGVEGDSRNTGVRGRLLDSAGNVVHAGLLGFSTYGVFSAGDTGASGMKLFVEPHATDPTRVVRFVALEGNESGTYFRGSARIVNGTAVIAVPEEFRMVTDEEGLTVQLTPVGAAASMFVASEDLERIVVHSNRDVKFHYQVNGIRRAYKDYVPIVEGQEFMPYSPSAGSLDSFPTEIRQRLISNGTYNADGSINMETAERVGWTRLWKEREERDRAAAAANAERAPKFGERK